jgi:hypothetical protein
MTTGCWPTRHEVARELARMDPPRAVGPALADMPKDVGWVDPDQGLVLTLWGLRNATVDTDAIDQGFLAIVKLCVDRYRNAPDEAESLLRRSDVSDLGLDGPIELALGEILLREAPFLGGGPGGAADQWQREITDSVVRYWGITELDEYLAVRRKELSPTGPHSPALASASKGPMTENHRDGTRFPHGLGVAWAVLAGFAGLVPFVAGSPLWITTAAVAAAACAGIVWHRRPSWPPHVTALALVAMAAGIGAAIPLLVSGLTTDESHQTTSARGGGTTSTPAPIPGTHQEQETLNHPAPTFRSTNGVNEGPRVESGQIVRVSCRVKDPTIPSVSPDGWWYRLASKPWKDKYYAPANTFLNGDPPQGPYKHNTDFSVPVCRP